MGSPEHRRYHVRPGCVRFLREMGGQVVSGAEGDVVTDVNPHVAEVYLPAEASRRSGLALCLSGGGYRAALFHLGALRRLNQFGVLGKVDTISAASGGSLLAAFLVTRLTPWPESGEIIPDERWDSTVAKPFRALARTNIRTGPLLSRLIPWNWPRVSAAVDALERELARHIGPLQLSQLPERPRIIFGATDLTFAVHWVSERNRVGDYQAGYAKPPPSDWTVARAVAASACFPPWFGPMPIRIRLDMLKGGRDRGPERDRLVEHLTLSDGGLYDNLALEPVWKRAATVLVSDGGGSFNASSTANPIARLMRYNTVQSRQALALRKRWLIASFVDRSLQGTYWGIGGHTRNYGPHSPAAYSDAVVDEVVSEIRTDFDAFSDAESAVLENHGYAITNAAIIRHTAQLVGANPLPYVLPHPEWLDEPRVRSALRESDRVRLLGRR